MWLLICIPRFIGISYFISGKWLMATDGIEGTFQGYVFVVISVTANVLLYGAVESVLWCLKRALTSAHS
jgi:hypothetical protein